jgi:ribosomal protein S18 acetylase RimI-like enzyme
LRAERSRRHPPNITRSERDLSTHGVRGLAGALELRPVDPGDEEFLYRVYASTRTDELAAAPWDDDAKEAFLRMQFSAQNRWYHGQMSDASYQVVLVDGERAGRLYVDRRNDEIRIVDVALLAEYRGRGIGTALMRELLAEGEATAKRVTIHVERFNPALHFYERLGFVTVDDQGVYLFLECPTAR